MTVPCTKHSLGHLGSKGKPCDPTLTFKGAFWAKRVFGLLPRDGRCRNNYEEMSSGYQSNKSVQKRND